MMNKLVHATIGIVCVTLACGVLPGDMQPPETPAITPLPPVSPTIFQALPTVEPYITPTLHLDIPGLTLDGLRNAEYRLAIDGREQTIRLADGRYQQGNDPASPGFLTVVLNEMMAFGDLNGDRVDDAVVILSEHLGGTGIFVSLAAVLNRAGLPHHVTSVLVDDRAIIKSLSIQDGKIILEAVVHGTDDPGCCPSLALTRTYILEEQRLIEQ